MNFAKNAMEAADNLYVNEFDRLLIEQGVSLIPRVPGTKEPPSGFHYSDRWDGKKIADGSEAASWGVHDRAAVCGVNHLVVFDFDSMESYGKFWYRRLADDLPNETLCVRTFRGIQVWFFDYSMDLSKVKNVIEGNPVLNMEIFLQKHLAAVPNNTHPSGKKYNLLGTVTIARKDGIVIQAVERLRSLHWVGSVYSDSASTPANVGDLSGQITDFDVAVKYFTPFWKRGHTHKFLLALSGYLIRENVSLDSALALVNAIIVAVGDTKSRNEALYQVRFNYRNAKNAKRLYGRSGLASIMVEIQKDAGHS